METIFFEFESEVSSALALQVLRRLGSIFTLVYAAVQKLKKDSWKEIQFGLVFMFKSTERLKGSGTKPKSPSSRVLLQNEVFQFESLQVLRILGSIFTSVYACSGTETEEGLLERASVQLG
ncbi:hypothetical protein Tco_1307824 [Tanacetum coccineum]